MSKGGDSCRLCALADIVVEEEDGLQYVRSLKDSKTVLLRIVGRLSEEDVLVRIRESRDPVELLQFLPHAYGKRGIELRPIAKLLSTKDLGFEEEELVAFGSVFWPIVVGEDIAAHNYAQAWMDIQRALPGWNRIASEQYDWVRDLVGIDELAGLAASLDAVERMTWELYAAMRSEGLVPDVPDGLKAIAISAYLSMHHKEMRLALMEA